MSSISLLDLEDSIRITLVLAAESDINPVTQSKLIDIFRKIRLSRLLDEQEFVSVGGTQGAGKTTFLETLYKSQNISDWLRGNIGRGEQTPILILEKDIDNPRAERLVFDPTDKSTKSINSSPEDFIAAVQNWNYIDKEGRSTLLTYLYVPKTHNINFGWMLLPGYEAETPSNHNWQGLMRYALLHASGMIFVTDETRMAQSQTSILDDIKQVASKVTPIIAISRGDEFRQDKAKLVQLINRATELYNVRKDNVIVAGTDFERWDADFANILQKSLRSGRHTQEDKLSEVLHIINYDLRDVINEIENLIADKNYGKSKTDTIIDNILEKFNESVLQYREDLAENLDQEMQQVKANAIKKAEEDYDEKETGFVNNVKIGLKHITFNSNEVDGKREKRIQNSFKEAYPISANLEAIKKASESTMNIHIGQSSSSNLLGYGKPKAISEKDFINQWDGVGKALTILLKKQSKHPTQLINTDDLMFEKGLAMLPAMSMEYMRLMQLSNINMETINLDFDVTEIHSSENLNTVIKTLAQNLNQTSENMTNAAKTILGSMATVLGFDSLDGTIGDGLSLQNNKATIADVTGMSTMAATRVLGAVLIVAGVVLTLHQASSHIARNDKSNKDYIREMIAKTANANIASILTQYDRAMKQLSRHIRDNLQDLYGAPTLGANHKLLIALNNLKQARKLAIHALKVEKELEQL